MTAPIVLFVFARPKHTCRTLNALVANPLAEKSDLIVYSDAARRPDDAPKVKEVRSIIRNIKGFHSLTIIERETNYGLARNIIEGVTSVCNQYEHVIVLEDDMITSPHFLQFMNSALDKYAEEKKVWHISGWNYPIDPNGLGDAFFWQVMNCWGWATWADRWQYFEKKPEKLIKTWNKSKIARFNLDETYDFWSQVKLNHSGKLNTWAVFWYSTIFEKNGLCLNPVRSLIQNIGHDGTGENCSISNFYSQTPFQSQIKVGLIDICESTSAKDRIKQIIVCTKKNHSKLFFFKKIILKVIKNAFDLPKK